MKDAYKKYWKKDTRANKNYEEKKIPYIQDYKATGYIR